MFTDLEPNVLDSPEGVTPEAQERFARNMMRTSKGTLRNPHIFYVDIALISVIITFIMSMRKLAGEPHFGFVILIYIACIVPLLLYRNAWRLDYDGSTEFVQYHTLLRGTVAYHVSELMKFEVKSTYRRGYERKDLIIHTADRTLSFFMMQRPDHPEPNADVEKFYTYLQLYRLYGSENGA